MIQMTGRKPTEPLRDVFGRVLFEEPGNDKNWYSLSEEKREPWRKDADRIIAMVFEMFCPFTNEMEVVATIDGGVDWLAKTPAEIWEAMLNEKFHELLAYEGEFLVAEGGAFGEMAQALRIAQAMNRKLNEQAQYAESRRLDAEQKLKEAMKPSREHKT